MRKLVIVLVMLMAAGMVFAATSGAFSGTTTGAEEGARVQIKLPLESGTGESAFTSVIVGFSTTPVVAQDTIGNAVTPVGDDTPINLVADGNGAAKLDTGKLYAYWQMSTPESVTVSLLQSGALAGDKSEEVINWTVNAADAAGETKTIGTTASESHTYGTESIELFKLTESDDTVQKKQGSCALVLATENYEGKPIDDYTADLVLKVTIA